MNNNIKDSLNKIVSMKFSEDDFGQSKMKADYKKQLSNILQLDNFNNIHHGGREFFVASSEIMYIADKNGEEINFISGRIVSSKKSKSKKKDDEEKYSLKLDPIFPSFSKLVIDYLLGRYVFYNEKLYDVNSKQAKIIDNMALVNLYGFKHSTEFLLDILKGIDKHCHVDSVRKLEPHQIAGNDFIIDLKTHTVTRKIINNEVSYFKHYPVDFENAKASKTTASEFLNYVIDDPESLHNAQLQAYYIAQVASGLRSKTNFFVTKSGVRTGKGLRHIALSGLFNKIDVELDNLTSRGFDALNAWALFSGGEMALATEQGDIIGDKLERVLKIIATERTHVARNVGGNQGLVYLTSVLCIDTNRIVSLSEEMNGRKILIQYRDRPRDETDQEREEAFEKYWRAFTECDKSPKIEGCIGFLLTSLEYFNQQGNKFIWKDVEVYNGNEALDDFQIELINRLLENDFVPKDYFLEQAFLKCYGKNNNKCGEAIKIIGVESYRKRIDGKLVGGYRITNRRRFDSFAPKINTELSIDFSIFEEEFTSSRPVHQ